MTATKRLYRSVDERKLAGVCAGIGDYLDLDPTVVRVAYLLGTIITGFFPGILIYFILALIMPEQPIHGDRDEVD
ncbi:MAG TPA: PspC domain-containing protein [Dehalococcoidia bacterium]